jgi:carboxyl-terminal processing protease
MLLEPSRRFEKPFDYNMSGMWIESDEKGRLQVQQLVPGSPAAEAGLEVGDLLTHVNGRPVTSRDLTRIVEMLRKEGAELSVEWTRDDVSIEAKIKLRPLV